MILNTAFLLSVSQAGAPGSFGSHGSDKFTKLKTVNITAGMIGSATFKKASKAPAKLGSSLNQLGGCPRMPFFPNSALCSKNYPRNINYMSAVIF
ncbi:MAG: hypothetical protein J7L16_02145 [Deltaproteobacteria bacterium]|nr:hypothetical protein [Deltaproteobacteria bacterium]